MAIHTIPINLSQLNILSWWFDHIQMNRHSTVCYYDDEDVQKKKKTMRIIWTLFTFVFLYFLKCFIASTESLQLNWNMFYGKIFRLRETALWQQYVVPSFFIGPRGGCHITHELKFFFFSFWIAINFMNTFRKIRIWKFFVWKMYMRSHWA